MKVEELHRQILEDVDGYVTNTVTNALTRWIKETGIPEIKLFAADYTSALMNHSNNETGWCRFRDRVFLPAAISFAIWLAEQAATKIIEETAEKN